MPHARAAATAGRAVGVGVARQAVCVSCRAEPARRTDGVCDRTEWERFFYFLFNDKSSHKC
jgi:hypothetical protein